MSDWEFFLKLCGVMPPTAPVNGPTPEEGLGHAPPAPPLTPEETDMAKRLRQGFRESGWWGRQ